MTEQRRKRVAEYDSVLLAATHAFIEMIIRVTILPFYRLFGLSWDKVQLRHAEIYLISTTLFLAGLIGLSQFYGFLGWAVVILGNIRLIQIVVLNLNSLIFDLPSTGVETELVKRARWHFVAIGFSFLDAVMIFGFLFQFFDRLYGILNHHYEGFFNYFYYAVITITTIGYGDIYPVTPFGKLLVMYEAITALLFIVLFVSGALARLHRN